MKTYIVFILFFTTIIINSETKEWTEEQRTAYKKYPHIFCAICRGSGFGDCRGCPFLEDVNLCGVINNFEALTKRKVDKYNEKDLKENVKNICNENYDNENVKLGHHLTNFAESTGWGQCVLCNMVLGFFHYLQNEVFGNPELEEKLDHWCYEYGIKDCTPELIHSLIKALIESTEGFYNFIGVTILKCPDLTQMVNDCFGG